MGTHYKGTQTQIRALNAYINLVRAAGSVNSRLARTITAHQLTASQFGVLEALLHLGPMRVRDLGKKLLKTSGNITMVIDNLEKRALVRRDRSGQDRRSVKIHLTNKGKRLISSIFPQHVQAIAKEMGVLNAREQDILRELCKFLGRKERSQGGCGE